MLELNKISPKHLSLVIPILSRLRKFLFLAYLSLIAYLLIVHDILCVRVNSGILRIWFISNFRGLVVGLCKNQVLILVLFLLFRQNRIFLLNIFLMQRLVFYLKIIIAFDLSNLLILTLMLFEYLLSEPSYAKHRITLYFCTLQLQELLSSNSRSHFLSEFLKLKTKKFS